MTPLTARQSEVLTFIATHIEANGWPPTIREIGRRFGIRSNNGVRDHLLTLERKGAIQVDHGRARAIRILPHHAALDPSVIADDMIRGLGRTSP